MWKFPTTYILGFGGYVETICYQLMLMNHCYLCVIMQKCREYFGPDQLACIDPLNFFRCLVLETDSRSMRE